MSQVLAFPVGRTAAQPVSRPEVQRRARKFSDAMRDQVKLMHGACSPRPQPQTLFQDVIKGKPASDETLFAAIVAGAANANMPESAVNRFVHWMHTELLSLRGQRALPSRATLWMHDTEAEGVANVGEQQFDGAMMRGDVAAVERIIQAKSAQVSAAYQLLMRMVADRDDMQVRT